MLNFLLGCFFGFLFTCFLTSIGKNNQLTDAYVEGYKQGLEEGKNGK